MAYAIMRCKKLKGMGSVASSLKHCYRERDTPNADPERTPENVHALASSTDEAMGKLRELLPEKRRKDAVLAVEYVMTASPEWWEKASHEQQEAFFQRSTKWLADKYGRENIFVASIHYDEKTPHLSAFVVPKTLDGRLSAKEFIGDRGQMSLDQSTYAQAVADLGLERGIQGSRAHHQTIKGYYAAIQQEKGHVEITAAALEPRKYKPQGISEKLGLTKRVETPEAVAERLTKSVREVYAPAIQTASGARIERQKAKEAQDTALDLRNRLQPVVEVLAPLNQVNQAKMVALVKFAGEKLTKEQQEAQRQKAAERQQRQPNRGKDQDSGIDR